MLNEDCKGGINLAQLKIHAERHLAEVAAAEASNGTPPAASGGSVGGASNG